MVNITYFTEYSEKIKTITFKKEQSPFRCGLGYHTDINGVKWDVKAIVGNKINARPVNNNDPYYSRQVNDNLVELRSWLPYNVKLI